MIAFILFTTAVIALGMAAFAFGWRGRRIDDHPLCARCRFDLHRAAEESTRCPECGADLTANRAVTVGHRRRQRGLLVIGSLMLAAGLALGTLGLSGAGPNIAPWTPTWLLIRQAQWSSGSMAGAALIELASRLQNGEMSDEQIDDFLTNAIQLKVSARPQVRSGDQLPIAISWSWDPSAFSAIMTFAGVESVRLGEESTTAGAGGYGAGGPSTTITLPVQLPEFTPGTHGGEVTIWLAFGPPMGAAPPAPQVTRTFPIRTQIVAADQPLVVAVRDESLREAVAQSISVQHAMATAGTPPRLNLTLRIEDPPMDVAFEVVARQGDREWPLGTVRRRAGASAFNSLAERCEGLNLDAGTIELVLRTSIAAAEDSADFDEIWDGEIALEAPLQ